MSVLAYVDTSAAMKLLVDEAETDALLTYLEQSADLRMVASWLLSAELHCAAGRHPEILETPAVVSVLETVNLVDVTRGDLLTAGTLPGRLRSNDAIHLATALRLGVDILLTYDKELAAAAKLAGIATRAPA